MEYLPERKGQAIEHAGEVPGKYVLDRRDELLDFTIRNSLVDNYDTDQTERLAEGLRTVLETNMGLCDPALYDEFFRVAQLVGVNEDYPDVIDDSDDLPFSPEAKAVLTGQMFAYYTTTRYLLDYFGIDSSRVHRPRRFYPPNTELITADSMQQRGLAIDRLGRQIYMDIYDNWEPSLDQFPEVVGGKDMIEYARVGIGYASDRVHEINRKKIKKYNYELAKKEGFVAGKMIEDMTADEIMNQIGSEN